MKHTISAKAKCPYYKHHDPQMVYCQGVGEHSTIHLAFDNKTTFTGQMDTFCKASYHRCPIFEMLSEVIG